MLRNYEERPGVCPPQVEFLVLSGRYCKVSVFSFVTDVILLLSFHFQLLLRLLLTQRAFAESRQWRTESEKPVKGRLLC